MLRQPEGSCPVHLLPMLLLLLFLVVQMITSQRGRGEGCNQQRGSDQIGVAEAPQLLSCVVVIGHLGHLAHLLLLQPQHLHHQASTLFKCSSQETWTLSSTSPAGLEAKQA